MNDHPEVVSLVKVATNLTPRFQGYSFGVAAE